MQQTMQPYPARRRRAALLGRVLVLSSLVVLAACAKDKVDDLALDDTPPAVLYNQGLALRAAGKLSDAGKKFSQLDKAYPYSEYSRKALINLAYLNFSMGKYPETIAAAQRFLQLYPGSDDAAYALYLQGQSYYRQIPDVSRDQEETQKALASFSELLQRYPDSEYAPDARKRLLMVQDQLAGKEMSVGRFYLKKRDYVAAINRFKDVILHYQTTRHVEEALARLTEAYYALGVVSEAQTAAAVLGHNFPDSQWYKDSYDLLKKGGYSPSEDKSSWISRAFSSVKIL